MHKIKGEAGFLISKGVEATKAKWGGGPVQTLVERTFGGGI